MWREELDMQPDAREFLGERANIATRAIVEKIVVMLIERQTIQVL